MVVANNIAMVVTININMVVTINISILVTTIIVVIINIRIVATILKKNPPRFGHFSLATLHPGRHPSPRLQPPPLFHRVGLL